jgi:hypothetical protein
MAEKVNITFQPAKKKVPKGQFLQGSRNWQKCSALYIELFFSLEKFNKKSPFFKKIQKIQKIS